MNKSNNMHMNIFEGYDQNGKLPIENNISRALAILLQEEPGLIMLLLQKISEKNKNNGFKVYFPACGYTVDFQKQVKDFNYYTNVIGVALTSEDIMLSNDIDSVTAEERQYITDISLFYDDTLIIIEVKRTNENCEQQLREQIKRYKDLNKENGDTVKSIVVSINWTEIIELIMSFIEMTDKSAGRIVMDYCDYLKRYYPEWFPVKRLNELADDEKDYDRIMQRLHQIKELYVKKILPEQTLIGGSRAAIPLNEDFVSECHIEYDKEHKRINVMLHPSDTCGQFWSLIKLYNKGNDFLSKSKQTITLEEYGKTINVSIVPYIKFSHFSRGLMWLALRERDYDTTELFDFAKSFTGRKKDETWDKLWESIKAKKEFFSEDDLTAAEKEFDEIYKDRKAYADVSLGFDIIGYIDYTDAKKLDENDLMVEFLEKLINGIITEIK